MFAVWSRDGVNTHRHPVLLWAFALLLATGFAALGHWQLGRRAEKRAMLEAAGAALSERRPQGLAVLGDPERASAYDWMTLRGRFADAPAVLLDNQRRGNAVGVRAYRVFLVDTGAAELGRTAVDRIGTDRADQTDRPQPVLLELGWLPLPPDRQMPAIPRPQGDIALSGLALPPPGSGLAIAPPAPGEGGALLATRLDLIALASMLGLPALPPRVFRPEPGAGFGDEAPPYARDFDILPNTLPPERHLGYAVQWFALSATVLVVALVLSLRMRRRRALSTETRA